MPTFKEQQESLVRSQHLLAVWEYIYAHLDDTYISKDGREVEKALKVPGCLVDLVSEDTIDEVLTSISTGPIAKLRAAVEAIENQEIVVMEKDDKNVKPKKQR